jgi:hypothetical protein
MVEEITSPRASLCAHFVKDVFDSCCVAMLASRQKCFRKKSFGRNMLALAENHSIWDSDFGSRLRESYNSTASDTTNSRAESEELLG